jgi:hypothetical protein
MMVAERFGRNDRWFGKRFGRKFGKSRGEIIFRGYMLG